MNDKLTKLTEVLEDFRNIYPEMPVQTMLVLLLIAQKDGIGVLRIGEALGIAQSSASRNVDVLGRGSVGKEGLGLVEAGENPVNRREKLVKLTRRGEKLIESLKAKL